MQLIFDPSVPSFDVWACVDSHSSDVERPYELGHSTTIRDELFPSVRGFPNLRIDSPHKLDHG